MRRHYSTGAGIYIWRELGGSRRRSWHGFVAHPGPACRYLSHLSIDTHAPTDEGDTGGIRLAHRGKTGASTRHQGKPRFFATLRRCQTYKSERRFVYTDVSEGMP